MTTVNDSTNTYMLSILVYLPHTSFIQNHHISNGRSHLTKLPPVHLYFYYHSISVMATSTVAPTKDEIAACLCLAARFITAVQGKVIPSNQQYGDSQVKRIIDALSVLCISEPHQTMAIALRVLGHEVEVIVAENDTVQDRTIEHLQSSWSLLQQLSTCATKRQDSPNNAELDEESCQIIRTFRITMLQFVSVRLKYRLEKHLNQFLSIEMGQFQKGCAFWHVYTAVLVLNNFMRSDKAIDEKSWNVIWSVCEMLQSKAGCLQVEDMGRIQEAMPNKFDIVRYLTKITCVVKSIKALLGAAKHPRYRFIFRATFTVTRLEPRMGEHNIPDSTTGWEAVISRLLEEKNRRKQDDEHEYELDEEVVQMHTKLLTEKHSHPKAYVHNECLIIRNLLLLPTPRAYSYIGVSKLSCRGCFEYIRAANSVHGTRFITRGWDQKWTFPWGFASIQKEDKVAAKMYNGVATMLSRTYWGFQRKIPDHLSDRDSQTTPKVDEPHEKDL